GIAMPTNTNGTAYENSSMANVLWGTSYCISAGCTVSFKVWFCFFQKIPKVIQEARATIKAAKVAKITASKILTTYNWTITKAENITNAMRTICSITCETAVGSIR